MIPVSNSELRPVAQPPEAICSQVVQVIKHPVTGMVLSGASIATIILVLGILHSAIPIYGQITLGIFLFGALVAYCYSMHRWDEASYDRVRNLAEEREVTLLTGPLTERESQLVEKRPSEQEPLRDFKRFPSGLSFQQMHAMATPPPAPPLPMIVSPSRSLTDFTPVPPEFSLVPVPKRELARTFILQGNVPKQLQDLFWNLLRTQQIQVDVLSERSLVLSKDGQSIIIEFPESPRLLEGSQEAVVPSQSTVPEITEIDPEKFLFEKIIELETSLDNQRAISLGTDLIVGAFLEDITEVQTTLKKIQNEFPETVSLILRLAREASLQPEMCESLDRLISIQAQKEDIELLVTKNGRAYPREVLKELRNQRILATNQDLRDFIDQKIKDQLQLIQKLSSIWTGSLTTYEPIAPVEKTLLPPIPEAWLEGDADEVSSEQSSREPSFLESIDEGEEPVEEFVPTLKPVQVRVLEDEPTFSWKIESEKSIAPGMWGKVDSLMDWTASKVSSTLARLPKWIYEPIEH